VEGYVESAATGLIAGLNAVRYCRGTELLVFPPETAHGALCYYLVSAEPDTFQPMNINFGLFPPLKVKVKKKLRRKKLAERALHKIVYFSKNYSLLLA
jgi:methylenetetrahydrofolate--tRNA-(uracil-5-)-methyltransferase